MKVSVIVTAYNRRKYLPYALKSVINQTAHRNDYEIILIKNFMYSEIDDLCSENRIKNIYMYGTIGNYLSRGLRESTGDIITFLDDDDVFTSDKIERIIKIYDETKFDFLHNNYDEIDDNGNKRSMFMGKLHFAGKIKHNIEYKKTKNEKIIRKMLNEESDFNLSCMSISSKMVKNVVNIIDSIYTCPDGFIFYSSIESGNMIAINDVLTHYRVHTSTTNELNDYKKFSLSECDENKRQIESLEILLPFLSDKAAIDFLSQAIALKKLKSGALKCRDVDIDIKSLSYVLKPIINFNIYAGVWFALYLLAFPFGGMVGIAIYKYMKNING